MNPELDRALWERWPLIFSERHGDSASTAMCWGFECGDGWYGLIDDLCEALQGETDNEGAPQIGAMQVKEKLGSLRFRAREASERQRAMIRAALFISERIDHD